MRKVKWFLLDVLQTFFILLMHLIFLPFSFQATSNAGGALGRWLGMRLPRYRERASQNLKRAMPELSAQRHKEIIEGMFDNVVRTAWEYLVLKEIKIYSQGSRVEVVGTEIIDQLRDDQKPAILFLGHLANWEIGTLAGIQRGLDIIQVYRKLNYPLTDRLINFLHSRFALKLITKSKEGARQLLQAVKDKKHVSMLNDQKLNEGDWIPFFGMPAKTASGGAKLALKHNCPFVPVRVERIDRTGFRVTYYPPLISTKENPQAQLIDLLTQMNNLLESWIRERPEQWFWLHNRWPKGYHKI